MKDYADLLEEALEAWEGARTQAIDELKNIPADQFDFRPNEKVRSVREIAIHILEIAMMMTGELTREDTNFRRKPWPDLLQMHAAAAYKLKSRKEILDMLQSSLKDGIKKFQQAGELHMLQFIQRFDGKRGTRLAWFYHGIAQEQYHTGQLATYARLLGLVPALTQSIESAE